jgi:hypothetical protein
MLVETMLLPNANRKQIHPFDSFAGRRQHRPWPALLMNRKCSFSKPHLNQIVGLARSGISDLDGFDTISFNI